MRTRACGPARRVFAALAAAATRGRVVWITGGAVDGGLHPDGVAALFDPSRLITVSAPRGFEALWATEEALRSGAAPLVVVEPSAPPGLTPVRRLHLAAQAAGAAAPLCLILTPEGGAAAAVETRWRADPLPADPAGAPRWRLALTRDKAGPPGVWEATGRAFAAAAGPAVRLRAA